MRICKYCGKQIDDKDIWNPDKDGNGYHHKCLIEMEFRTNDRLIYNKGKTDVLDKIRAEIQKVLDTERDFTSENAKAQAIALNWCLDIIDKYKGKA